MKSKRKFGGIILIVIGVVFLIWSTFSLMVREDMDLSESSGYRSLIVLFGGSLLIFVGIKLSIFEHRWYKWNKEMNSKSNE